MISAPLQAITMLTCSGTQDELHQVDYQAHPNNKLQDYDSEAKVLDQGPMQRNYDSSRPFSQTRVPDQQRKGAM
jgi:hypothetical protein